MNKKFWQKRNILITGANGFVGSSLFSFFENNNIKAYGGVREFLAKNKNQKNIILLDVLNRKKLQNVCQKYKIDMIIHCASLDGNSEFKKHSAIQIINENVQMTLNILETSRELNVKDVIIMSSSKIYSSTNNLSAYTSSKLIGELLADIYAKEGINIFIPRPCNIYGPDDTEIDRPGRVVQAMIKKAIANEKIEIWGDGKQKKQFIFIDDFIKVLIEMIEVNKYHALNIGHPQAISIEKLANTIKNIFKNETNVVYKAKKLNKDETLIMNLSEQKELADFKFTPITTGLKETINYYKQHGKE